MKYGAAVLLIALASAGVARGDDAPAPPLGDLRARPVFYEQFPPAYARDDLALLHRGRVRLQHFPARDVASFTWARDEKTDYTWWMQMQELRFLLPAIESDKPADRALARSWFQSWFEAHMLPEPATASWGEPMTVAYRALVLVRFLERETMDPRGDADVRGLLQAAILEHQLFLAAPANFDEHSNHGFIDALGLLETTRVFDDKAARALGFARLQSLTARSFSARGLHLEHAPYYHFVVLTWLTQAQTYAAAFPDAPPGALAVLRDVVRRAGDGAYFLQDHAGRIPQVGDTDSSLVGEFAGRTEVAPRGETRCFDPEAGYAVFKGDAGRGDRRYVLFRIQERRSNFVNHMHADVLSVIAAHDGETLLGDAGRYSYTASNERGFFLSPRAHNTVGPQELILGAQAHAPRLADAVADRSTPAGAVWRGHIRYPGLRVSRQVSCAGAGGDLVVVDSLRAGGRQGRASGAAARTAVLLWNAGPDVTRVDRVRVKDREFSCRLQTASGREALLTVRITGAGKSSFDGARVASGATQPRLGWYSPRQGIERPVSVAVLPVRVESMAVVETRLEFPKGRRSR